MFAYVAAFVAVAAEPTPYIGLELEEPSGWAATKCLDLAVMKSGEIISAHDSLFLRVYEVDGDGSRRVDLPEGVDPVFGGLEREFVVATWPSGAQPADRGGTSIVGTVDVATGARTALAELPSGFAPDHAASSSDGTVLALWTMTQSGYLVTASGTRSLGTRVMWVAISADGRRIAVTRQKQIDLVDPATGAIGATLPGLAGRPLPAAFSPDGRNLAVGGNGAVMVIAEDGTPRWQAPSEAPVEAVGFSPDGGHLAVHAGQVRVFDAHDGSIDAEAGPPSAAAGIGLEAVAWSDDGAQVFATRAFASPLRWRWRDGPAPEIEAFDRAAGFIRAVAMAPDGSFAVTVHDDGLPAHVVRNLGRPRGPALVVWDTRTGLHRDAVTFDEAESWTWRVAVSPDSTTAYVAIDGALVAWNIDAHAQVWATDHPVASWSVHPDGRILAATAEEGLAWLDSGTGAILGTIPRNGVVDLTIAPNGQRIAVSYADRIDVLALDGAVLATLARRPKDRSPVWAGDRLVAPDADGGVTVLAGEGTTGHFDLGPEATLIGGLSEHFVVADVARRYLVEGAEIPWPPPTLPVPGLTVETRAKLLIVDPEKGGASEVPTSTNGVWWHASGSADSTVIALIGSFDSRILRAIPEP